MRRVGKRPLADSWQRLQLFALVPVLASICAPEDAGRRHASPQFTRDRVLLEPPHVGLGQAVVHSHPGFPVIVTAQNARSGRAGEQRAWMLAVYDQRAANAAAVRQLIRVGVGFPAVPDDFDEAVRGPDEQRSVRHLLLLSVVWSYCAASATTPCLVMRNRHSALGASRVRWLARSQMADG